MPHPYARQHGSKGPRTPKAGEGRNTTTAKRVILIWTDAEKERLARDSLALMKQFPDLSRTETLRRAVMRLPKERRKPVSDINHNMWIVPLWQKFAEERDAMNEAAGVVEPQAPENVSLPFAAPEPDDTPAEPAAATADAPKKHRGMKPGTKLTRWSAAERRTVAKGFLKLQADFPDLSLTECVRRSMQYNLPDNRQRTVAGYSMEKPWLEPLLAEVENEVKIEREAQAQHRAEVEAAERAQAERAHEIEALNQTAAELATIAAAEARETALADFKASVTIEELLGMFARKLVKSIARPLIESLREEVAGALSDLTTIEAATPVTPALRAVAPPPRDRKPRVGVVGLIRQQAQQMEHDYAGRCEFVFGGDTDGTGPSAMSSKLSRCDVVFFMGEYVSHEIKERLKAAHVKYVPLMGSMSACRRELDQWLQGEARLAA